MPKINWQALNSLSRARHGKSHPIKDSPLSNPAVQKIVKSEQVNTLAEAKIGISPALGGSPLADPAVRQIIGNEQIGTLAEARVGASPALGGSALSNPAYRQQLGDMAKEQSAPGCMFIAKNALNGGELSPFMAGRFDQPRHLTGCKLLRNMIAMPQGGIARRPGLEYLGCIPGAVDSLFIPFVFSATESFMIEIAAEEGHDTVGMNIWLSDGSLYKMGVLTLPYTWQEVHEICWAQSADTIYLAHSNHPPAKIMRYGMDDWRYEAINWLPTIGAPEAPKITWEGNPGEWSWKRELATYKYIVTAVDAETGEESAPSPVAKIEYCVPLGTNGYYIVLKIKRVPGASEYRVYKKQGGIFGFIGRVPDAEPEPEENETEKPGTGGDGGGDSGGDAGADAGTGEAQNADEGIAAFAEGAGGDGTGGEGGDSSGGAGDGSGGDGSGDGGGTGGGDGGAGGGDGGDNPGDGGDGGGDGGDTPGDGGDNPGGDGGGDEGGGDEGGGGGEDNGPGGPTGDLAADGDDPDVVKFEDRNILPDVADTPSEARDPWNEAEHPDDGWPAIVFFHQQRLCFARTYKRPMTIWMSEAGNYESMAASTPPQDDQAIEVTMAATQCNRILWCNSDRNVLCIGTEGGEWILTGAEGDVLTPANLMFQPQTHYGSAPLGQGAIRAGSSQLFVQFGARSIREFCYAFQSDSYQSADLSVLARHILEPTIIFTAWQGDPYNILWCVLADGNLAGLTYLKEQEVIAWHRHDTPGGKVVDIAALPDGTGQTQIWMHVNRNGMRCVERFRPYREVVLEEPLPAAYFADGPLEAPFESFCIPYLPETTLQTGSTWMRVRKLNAVKAHVLNCRPFKARIGDGPWMNVPERSRHEDYASNPEFWSLPIAGGWRENADLVLKFTNGQATILGILATLELADLSGSQS